MPKLFLSISILSISLTSFAQRFETNLYVSPFVTNVGQFSPNFKISWGFSGGAQEFFHFTNSLDIGIGINYNRSNYSYDYSYGTFNSGSIPHYKSKLTLHSMYIPFLIRTHHASGFSLQLGIGYAYLMDYNADVQYIGFDRDLPGWWNSQSIQEVNLKQEDAFYSVFEISLGKKIEIGYRNTYLRLFYEVTLNDIVIDHESAESPGHTFDYPLKLNKVGLIFCVAI